MELSKKVTVLLAALLVVVNYLLLEANISHTWHVVIVCVSLFLGAIGIQTMPSSNKENEVKI